MRWLFVPRRQCGTFHNSDFRPSLKGRQGESDVYWQHSAARDLHVFARRTTRRTLPDRWTPEVKVKVDWVMGHWMTPYETRKHLSISEQIACCSTERVLSKTVPVERYDEKGGRLQVFFLPDDKVQVWVYGAGPQNPDHPSGRGYPRNPNPEK